MRCYFNGHLQTFLGCALNWAICWNTVAFANFLQDLLIISEEKVHYFTASNFIYGSILTKLFLHCTPYQTMDQNKTDFSEQFHFNVLCSKTNNLFPHPDIPVEM